MKRYTKREHDRAMDRILADIEDAPPVVLGQGDYRYVPTYTLPPLWLVLALLAVLVVGIVLAGGGV